jgi:hypothetical protein
MWCSLYPDLYVDSKNVRQNVSQINNFPAAILAQIRLSARTTSLVCYLHAGSKRITLFPVMARCRNVMHFYPAYTSEVEKYFLNAHCQRALRVKIINGDYDLKRLSVTPNFFERHWQFKPHKFHFDWS